MSESKVFGIVDSTEESLEGLEIAISAPAGEGKTTVALSVSKKFPDTLPAKEETVIDDVLVVRFDSKGTLGLRSMNIRVPYVLAVDLIMRNEKMWKECGFEAQPNMSDMLAFVEEEAAAWIKKHPGGSLVCDTVSAIQEGLLSEYSGVSDGRAKYGTIRDHHIAHHFGMARLPFDAFVWNVHTKALIEDVKTNVETKGKTAVKNAGKALGGAEIIPDVSGQSWQPYQRACVGQFPLVAHKVPGQPHRERWIHTVQFEGRECKNRFEQALDPKEPANIRHILTKISKYQKENQ